MLASVRHYRVVRPLGAGGMGEVCLAQDLRLDRPVALKFLSAESVGDARHRQRFLTEAKAVAALNHPNICTIYEVGEAEDGRPFIAMELLEGATLADRLKGRRMEMPELIEIGLQIADALAAAHAKGIVHRDIKPSNLHVIAEGRVKVLDFGVAKRLTAEAGDEEAATQLRTQTGQLLGTPNYMSPEQALGKEVDGRTDLFSLGAVLYEMVTGRAPFAGRSLSETLEKILHSTPEALARFNYAVPSELERVILKCLRKAPEERYQAAGELMVDLRSLKESLKSPEAAKSSGVAPAWAGTGQVVTLLFLSTNGEELERVLGALGAAQLLRAHELTFQQQLTACSQATVLESAGNTTLLRFARPSSAVQFALGIQMATIKPLTCRMGIHLGEVMKSQATEAHGQFGEQLVICERLLQLARPGQILLSRAVFDSARPVLKREELNELNGLQELHELSWLNHGPYLLEGIEDAVEICEVAVPGQKPSGPPATSAKARRQMGEEQVLGWRPALGQLVPNTKWVLEQKLGEGGFGEVWLGRHETLKERRVFKFCFRADRVRSLKREMTLFRLLKERIGDHPNIVRLLEVYFDEPPFYVVMDHVEGQDLKACCEQQAGVEKVPLAVRLEIVAQIADALQAAHDAGVIHRDVKPGNILVAAAVKPRGDSSPTVNVEGEPRESQPAASQPQLQVQAKLTDFGIGQVVSQEVLAGITKTGFTQTIIAESSSSQTGSQMYMAPELLAGKPASTRSDIYSLGVVLYQLLVADLTRPLTTDWGDHIADPLLRDDLRHCFAGNPNDRFAGAGQLAKQLRALPERQNARTLREAEQAARERAAYRLGIVRTTAVAALVIAAVVSLAIFAFSQSRQARQSARNLRQSLYAADMHLALQAHQDGNLARTRELVDAHRPKKGEADLRGFEWRYLWGLCQEQSLHTFREHAGWVAGVAMSRDGKLMASGGEDKIIKLLDITSRRVVGTFQGHTNHILSLAFSPDGRMLASASGDTTVKLWDLASQGTVHTFQGHTNGVLCVAFTTDGKTLASGSADGTVKLWDVRSYEILGSLAWQKDTVRCLSISPNGKILAIGGHHTTFELWDMPERQRLATLVGHTAWVDSIAFSPNGELIATGSADSTVRLWNVKSRQVIATLRGHSAQVASVAFAPDGKTLASGSSDRSVKLWSLESYEEMASLLGHTDGVESVAFSPNGKILASGSYDHTVKLWSVESFDEARNLMRQPGWVTGLRFSPDGKRIVSGDQNYKSVTVWELATQRELTKFTDPVNTVFSGAFLPDEKTLVVFDLEAVRLRDIATWQEKARFSGHAATLSEDGKLLATVSATNSIHLWDVSSSREMANLEGGKGRIFLSRFSPDGTILVTGTDAGDVQVWAVAGRRQLLAFKAHSEGISTLAFSADGRLMATGGLGATLKLWNVASGQELITLRGHTGAIDSLAFSPDGATLASGSTDSSVKLWSVRLKQAVATLRGHTAPVSRVAFSPDGNTLATASGDATIRLWRAASFSEINTAETSKSQSP